MEPAHLPDSDKTILNRPEWDETVQDCDRIQHCDKIQNTNLFMRHGVLKYTRSNTGLDTCYMVCHVFCEIHFNMKTVELHYIDILNSHKRWSDSLWLTYKYTGGWNRLCIPLLPVTPLFTFSGLSDTQKSFSVISSWKCFLKWKNYSICHNTTHSNGTIILVDPNIKAYHETVLDIHIYNTK